MPDNPGGALEPEFDWRWADDEEAWVPSSIDTTVPSVARMYDYYLGGKDNFEIDRTAAGKVLEQAPDSRFVALANRGFLAAAIETMTAAGIRQFIDFGTGIPTSPNVHQLARVNQPGARVVYLDNDPVVLVHSRALLAGDEGVAVIQHDLREPAEVLADPQLRRLIDPSEPVGLLFVAVLHFVRHDIAPEIVSQYGDAAPPGSMIAVSAACRDGLDPELVRKIEEQYGAASAPLVFRTKAQIEELFDGYTLLEQGLTTLSRWREDSGSGGSGALCGVARRR